jgi:hypothetical protein
LCHVLELYIWCRMSSLRENRLWRGLDKSFAQVASGSGLEVPIFDSAQGKRLRPSQR